MCIYMEVNIGIYTYIYIGIIHGKCIKWCKYNIQQKAHVFFFSGFPPVGTLLGLADLSAAPDPGSANLSGPIRGKQPDDVS